MIITTTSAFFEAVARRGYEPRLRDTSGTWLFEITDDAAWAIDVDHGRLTTRRVPVAKGVAANVTLRCSTAEFLRMVRGDNDENLLTPFLRASVAFDGDLAFAVKLHPLIPMHEVGSAS